MSNFSQRFITGTVYVLLIFFSLIFHPLAFGLLTIIFNFIALGEFVRMALPDIKKGVLMAQITHSLLLLITVVLIHLKFDANFIFISGLLLLIYLLIIALFIKTENPVQNLSVNILSLIYITFPLILINFVSATASASGIPYVLAMFVIIWTNDTSAYLFGIAFGKHKIFERISPKKSWEGFFGGLIMIVIASVIFNYLFSAFGLLNWLLFGLITAIASVMGDFIESMFKRTYGVKDSGSFMPGHGGILDRIDSLLLAAPVVYIFLNFIVK
jgi:phosphatidate cytidylyltransferase